MRAVVIDDDAGLVAEVRAGLCPESVDVVACSEAAAAVQCVLDNRPDIVILDLEMEAPGGARRVLEQLRSEPESAGIPVIAVTPLPIDRRSITIPMHHVRVIARPFEARKLQALIRSMTSDRERL